MENILKGISGLNNAGRSNNGFRRIVWMVIFLVGLAGTLHSVIVVVEEILEYPVDTTVTITTDTSVRRPKSDEYYPQKISFHFTDQLSIGDNLQPKSY